MDKQLISTGNTWETNYPYAGGRPAPWTPVVKVNITNAYLIMLAGQVAYDDSGKIVGPNEMKTQSEKTYANIKQALTAAGAKVADVIFERAFVRQDFMKDYMMEGSRVRGRFYREGGVTHLPPFTVVGVAALAHEEQVLEVEVVAVSEK
ncbi:MAG: RidA family protein [Chloroflexi bacterium]|nr:RidA family protein [Chloroflexota bacterium]